jgi:hypothetical protein
MSPVGVGIEDGAAVALPGAPFGAPVPPEPAAAHAVVASSNAIATASSADRMALTS